MAIHREAGLPAGMLGVQPHFGHNDPAAVGTLAGIIHTAAPLIERTGVGQRQGDRRRDVRATADRQPASEPGGICPSHFAQRLATND